MFDREQHSTRAESSFREKIVWKTRVMISKKLSPQETMIRLRLEFDYPAILDGKFRPRFQMS